MRKRLPQTDALLVEQEKIVDYLLNHHHPDGASKARYFARFGFDAQHSEAFALALRQHGSEREVVEREVTMFGVKYTLVCAINTPDHRNPCVRTVWISEQGGAPRLVTAYPAGEG